MISFRPIFLVNGILLCILSGVMLIPMLVDLSADNPDWKVFASSAFISAFFGGSFFLANRGYQGNLNLRQAFLLTTSCYIVVSLMASVPIYLSELNLDFIDAYFEATSGITATGATVLTGLDMMPPGILMWRSLLNAMGGIGIVVLAMAILPMLQIGGMQLFRTESSETMEKMLPRATQIALVITLIFFGLVLTCSFCYWLAGMSGFDAINHGLTTVATGGFSTHDASIAYFGSVHIEIIAIIFMISGALPIILYYQIFCGNISAFLHNSQVQWFFGIVITLTTLLTLWLVLTQGAPISEALRRVLFSVVAIITTTGYAATDYSSWGSFATAIFFMLIVVGGCTGSTSGGIKIFRFQVLYQTARVQMQQLIQPHGVFIPRYNGNQIPTEVSQSVMTFLLLFAFSFMVLAIALSFFELDFLTAMSASAMALANVGPGLGDIIGPAGSYASLADGAKWLLAVAMIAGRLELFTVLVLFVPSFWRD